MLGCVAEAHAPAGLTPWLRALERRGLHLDWMGNEAGNHPLRLLERPATEDVHGAMLQLAREELPRDGAEVWEDWSALQRERGAPRAGAGFRELVVGAPERGWWRDADEEELAANLEARAAEYSARGTPDARLVWSRHVAGDELLARVRAAVERLVALAIFDVPDEECVVVWYLLGGRSRASGQLELVALERVWS
ncbi:MAG: hypothetical protein H6713_12770 [Myxococcales bacterium]|nr:hypothetical protein [Myxococcales bacterium]